MSSGSAVIAPWAQLFGGHSPEEFALRLLHAADVAAEFDVPAVRRAWRRSIEQGLPDGFHLRGSTFHGPAEGLRHEGGRLVDAVGRTALQLHQAVLEEAVGGPDRDPEQQLWAVAARYRLSAEGLRVCGAWHTFTGDTAVEDTVRAALNRWGRSHGAELSGTGRYGFGVLHAALAGRLGSETAITAAVTAAYRNALSTVLPPGFTLDDNDAVRGPHPKVEGVDVAGAVHAIVVTSVITTVLLAPRELLTAQQVVDLIGAVSADSARHTLSRWGVTAAQYVTG